MKHACGPQRKLLGATRISIDRTLRSGRKLEALNVGTYSTLLRAEALRNHPRVCLKGTGVVTLRCTHAPSLNT